jgi:hypothetical protein
MTSVKTARATRILGFIRDTSSVSAGLLKGI